MTEFCLKILNSLHQVSVSLLNVVETVIFQPSSLSLSVNLILLYYQILFVPAFMWTRRCFFKCRNVWKRFQESLFAWYVRTAVGTLESKECVERKRGRWNQWPLGTTVTLSCQRSHSKRIHVNGGGKGTQRDMFLFHTTQGQRSATLSHIDGSVSEKETETVILLRYWMKRKKQQLTPAFEFSIVLKKTAVKKNFITTFFPRINDAPWAWCNGFRLCYNKGTKKPDHLSQK